MNEVRTLEEMIKLNKARTQDEFEAALSMTAMPSINYVYADKDGNIAHYYNAMMPKRTTENINWEGLIAGDQSSLIWDGYHAFEKTPRTVNPQSGFVYNANNTPFEATIGERQAKVADFVSSMGIESHMTNRAMRIKELFSKDHDITRADMKLYQYDNVYAKSSVAAAVVEAVLEMQFEEGADLHEAQKILAKWDRKTDTKNTSAALAVLTAYPSILAKMKKEKQPDVKASLEDAIELLKKHFDKLDPEWGELNQLKRGDKTWPLSGAPDVLRAVYGEFDPDLGRQLAVAGDSYIMFVEWSPDGALFVETIHNFGSATLDATSAHYDDQAPLFAKEQVRRLPLDMKSLEAEKTSDIQLGSRR